MKTEIWKITGPVAIRGHAPGAEFAVEVTAEGIPVDAYWRKRKREELELGDGYISFPAPATGQPSKKLGASAPSSSASDPASDPVSAPSK